MKKLIILLFLSFHFFEIYGQTPLFQSEEPLQLTLKADLSAFEADRSMKADYHKAKLLYSIEGKEIEVPMKMKVRGRFRRDQTICNFPPVKVNFKKGGLPHPFEDQDKLKLVTHCQGDETILREYYVYKIYNLITPTSFRVRLARITYVDEAENLPAETHWAFFIESEEHLADRNAALPIDEDLILRKPDVNRQMLATVHLFNYMIANSDFDITVRQNVKIIGNGRKKPIVVPYDFDWAGIVAAPYTIRNDDKKHPYYERRRFKNLCLSDQEWEELLNEFNNKKEDILDLYQNSPYLSNESIRESVKLLKKSFRHINRKKTREEVFQKKCK